MGKAFIINDTTGKGDAGVLGIFAVSLLTTECLMIPFILSESSIDEREHLI